MKLLLCVLLIGLSAVSAVPFFAREVLGPEPVYVPAVEEPLPYDNYEVPPGQAFHFAFQMPQLDLSNIFKPLRLFAGVNLPAVVQQEARPRECDSAKFDLTKDESQVVTDCQEQDVGGSLLDGNDRLKQCIVAELPKSSVELREFLDREEFALISLNSAYSISFVDGTFEQKRSITFQLCPKDELNSIDGQLPPEVAPDRIDTEAVVPVAAVPELAPSPLDVEEPIDEHRPLFQFGIPQLQLPDFNELFQPLFSLVPDLSGPEGPADPEIVESTELNAARPEHNGGGGSGGFLSDLFSIFHPPVRTDIDVHDCANKRFDVPAPVYETASECKHADDYKTCLSEGVEASEESDEFLAFATDPEWEIVGSSFTRATFTYIDEVTTRNTIYLKRCRKIELETKTPVVEASSEEASGASAEESSIQEDELVPAESVDEQPIIESKIDEQASVESSNVQTVPETAEQETVPEEIAVPEVEEAIPAQEVETVVEEVVPEEDKAPETTELIPEKEEVIPDEEKVVPAAAVVPKEEDDVVDVPKEEDVVPAAEEIEEKAKEQLEKEKASSEVEVFPDVVEDAQYGDATAILEPLKEQPIEQSNEEAP